ncbi:unnamed protein product, partial [Rotaria sp. Silwood1]
RRDDPKKPLTLLHLIRLFKATRCSGKEISSLIELLTACISYAEPGAVDMKPYLIEPDHFEPVWRLYFDPLIIESVKCADSAIEKAACGQTVYSASRSITVKWSDGREDFYDDGNVEARERVDDLVHMALSVCVRKEQLMKLLESIQLCLSKADHVIPAWIRLYRHLTTLTLFDDDMSRILFDQFFTVDMYSPSQIVEFINELFEIWPKINDQNIVESVSINIAKLIENIIAFKTNESSTLVEQLIERICASTPAQNVRGHLCFYFLLHDTLALCNSKDLTSALKKVDLPILIWYADYVFLKTENTDQHRRYLLSILKNVSMFSQHDLLYHWIERTASSCVSEETIGFELIESSICPTSHTGSLKLAATIILAELLDLSPNEREILSLNATSTSDMNSNVEAGINDSKTQQHAFFSTEIKNKQNYVQVRKEDFVKAEKLLDELKKSAANKLDNHLRTYLPEVQPDSNILTSTEDENQDRLTLTETALENVSKVMEVINDPVPILLEGSTGVGKSASIMEAAYLCGRRELVRYNMSSRVSIDDLLGKVALVVDLETQSSIFQFVDGAFTKAFSKGYWLLLDELNLAQDTVLQAIESALDTCQLTINNTSSATTPIIIHKKHKDFRLFATQNPNSGFFKGKREKLSASTLSRFRPMIFKVMPDEEWRQIVETRLKTCFPDRAKSLSEDLVCKFNAEIKKMVADKNFEEIGPYTEISIRELLKWINLLIWQKKNNQWPTDIKGQTALLSFGAWCIYGARYRYKGRNRIKEIIKDLEWPDAAITSIKFRVNQENNDSINFDNIQCPARLDLKVDQPEYEWNRTFKLTGISIKFMADIWKKAFQVHTDIHRAILTDNFISSHGIYRINRAWLWEWLVSAAQSSILQSEDKLTQCGLQMYQSRFRHTQARTIIQSCFKKVYNITLNTDVKYSFSTAQADLPYVLTDRVLTVLKQVCFDLRIKQPILVTGGEACGKSELLLTLAWLHSKRIHQLNITPETEPTSLIGQLIPNDTQDPDDPTYGTKLIWQHGAVTEGYVNGDWVLLDNLATAESSVLERLNPVLEQNPMLILTERGDIDAQKLNPEYQLVATMTPPSSQQHSSVSGASVELSPALYNRFAIVHMEDMPIESVEKCVKELDQLAHALLPDDPDIKHSLAVDLCKSILSFYKINKQNFPKLTLRNIVRLLDSTYLLHRQNKKTLSFASILWTAFHVTIVNQIKDTVNDIRNKLIKEVEKLLSQNGNKPEQPNFIDLINNSPEHILTLSRKKYADAVLGAVACNIPLLLEGPAAVGKTALISHLCKHMKTNSPKKMTLERVNNTDTTTIQDYLGSFLPSNDGFVFKKGALYSAMTNGSWFLADEFNLADPSVMNMLFPLLEGKNSITIPSSGKVILAEPGFRFFATQNDASYANRHRLPDSLRNRFLEVQFGDFPQDELSQIIEQREEQGKQKPKCLNKKSAEEISKFYHYIINKPTRITFREIVKWLHRHSLFSPNTDLWSKVGISLLCAKYAQKSNIRKELIDDFNKIWPRLGKINADFVSKIDIKTIPPNQLCFTEDELSVDIIPAKLENSDLWNSNNQIMPPETFRRCLIRIAHAVKAREPILLVGPTSCKSLLVETWAIITNRSDEFIKVHLTPDTEAGDLIGEIRPHSFLDLLKQLPLLAERVFLRVQSLYRSTSNNGELSADAKIQLQPFNKLIKNDLPSAIAQFETKYAQNEKRRREQEELYDDSSNIEKGMTVVQSSPPSVSMGDTVTDLLESVNQSSGHQMGSNVHFSDMSIDEEYDIPFNNNSNFMQSTTYNNTGPSSNIDYNENRSYDDGFGTNNVIQSSTDVADDGFGEINLVKSSFDTYDDGFGENKQVQSIEKVTTTTDISDKNQVDDENLYDDGFNMLSYLPQNKNLESQDVNASSNTLENQSGVFKDEFPNYPSSTITSSDQYKNPTDDDLYSIQQYFYETPFPEKLMDCVDKILVQYLSVFKHKSFLSFNQDSTLHDYYERFTSMWDRLIAKDTDRTKPIFLFNDGPVTMTAKQGGIIFLEDLDLPSQAVIERLNSILEPSPTFALTEDITSQTNDKTKGQLDIKILPQFQIFASVHQEQEYQLLKLSPATRSRFTEIHVPSYTETDIKDLVTGELIKRGINKNQVNKLVPIIFSLREKLRKNPSWKVENDIQLLLRWIDFIFNQHLSLSEEHRLCLGARFFYFDQLPMSLHNEIFDEWSKQPDRKEWIKYAPIFQPSKETHGARTLESIKNSDINRTFVSPFEIGHDYIALRYTGVRYSWTSNKQIPTLDELKLLFVDNVPTPTLLNQIARIFAATSSKTPLLLEGPPGIGKTHVVTQVCKLLSKDCERINMSANTSLDQLIGCIIPRCINGRRIFEWQDGKVVDALRNHRWILFDELNLASPEVLQGLTPLFYRGSKQFIIPSTNESVDTSSILIFATMNPATIGGGRSKLPRSISNLFTIVQLEDYKDDELRIILSDLFRIDIHQLTIDNEQLSKIFELHKEIKRDVEQGIIGSMGGPYEMNLRDLSKFRDVFRGSIRNQMHHYQYINATDNETKDENFDLAEKTKLSIRKFAQVVYACQFQGQHDFKHVCHLIKEKFEIKKNLEKWENDRSIDAAIPNVVRIGSIYINTGIEEPNKILSGLIHTKQTIEQLELLATACQSKRAILLEGDICSRKSSLVIELARVTRNHLIVIPLHENFETSDLIGTWLPSTVDTRNNTLFIKIDKLFKQISKLLLLVCMPLLNNESNRYLFTEFESIIQQRNVSLDKDYTTSVDQFENIEYEKDTLEKVKTLFKPLSKMHQMPSSLNVFITCFVRQADYFILKLDELKHKGKDKDEVGFSFVESELVEAIREGWWVLLDNVNSAPPEVLERLNSLTEDNPMLSLYEKSSGEILNQKHGIHPNFRLFTTANLNRVHSNKLSSAFLNRVIKIWLPSMDADININTIDSIKSNDLYELLGVQLADVPAGKQLTELLLLTHSKVKQDVKEGKLVYPTDYTVTYRQLDQCVRTMIYHIKNQIDPVSACYWSILRSYASLLSDNEHYMYFVKSLKNSMNELKLNTMSIFSTSESVDTKQLLWIQDGNKIQVEFIEIERCLAEFIFGLIENISFLQYRSKEKNYELLNLFIDEILIRMYPENSNLNNIKQLITNSTDNQQTVDDPFELLKTLKIIESSINNQQQQNVEFNIRELIEKTNHLKLSFENVCTLLNVFIQNTSFTDTHERHHFLQRIISIAQIFTNFLGSSHFSPSLFQSAHSTLIFTFCNQLIGLIRLILTFKTKCISYEIFQEPAFVDAQNKFRIHMFQHFESGLIWAFERAHATPIMITRNDFSMLMSDVLNKEYHNLEKTNPIKYYHLLMQWTGLQWIFESFLTKSLQNAFQKNNCITIDFIIECETKLCCQTLTKKISLAIQQCIKAFPLESNTLEIDFNEAKTNLDKKQREIDNCKKKIAAIEKAISEKKELEDNATLVNSTQTQPSLLSGAGSIFDPNTTLIDGDELLKNLIQELDILKIDYQDLSKTHTMYLEKRIATIEKAQQARNTFLHSMKNLFDNEDCQFLFRRFQLPDSNQLNHLIELLYNSRQNPSLLQSDHTLNVQAVLRTEFGQILIDNDDILENPIIHFICGFFFLPSFISRVFNITVISSWKELRQDNTIQFRSLKQRHIVLYCPNKQSDQCCLLSVQNSAQLMIITMWTFHGHIDINELEEILSDILPTKIQRRYEQKLLERVTNMSDTDQQTFAISSLVLLQHDPTWKIDSEISLASTDLYSQVSHVYSQLKQFSQHNQIKRKQPTKLTYQNLVRFQSDLQKLSNEQIDNEWISIKNLSDLLKSYQNIFSSVNNQSLLQDVNNYIHTIQPPNIGSQITSLAFIQPLGTKYACIGRIDAHLRKSVFDNNTVGLIFDEKAKHFQLVFEFINKSIRLLKLLTQHVIYGSEHVLDKLYQTTPIIIVHLEKIFQSTLSMIDLNESNICTRVVKHEDVFHLMQTELDQYLNDMFFTPFVSKYNLQNFVLSIAPLFQERRRIDETKPNPPPGPSIPSGENRNQKRIDECIKKLNELLTRADTLPIRPHEIIGRIRNTLGRLQLIDINKDTEARIQLILAEEKTLTSQINSYIDQIKQKTILKKNIPKINAITPLTFDDLQLDNSKLKTSNQEIFFRDQQTQITKASSSQSFTQLAQVTGLINQQVANRTWIQALSLVAQNEWISTNSSSSLYLKKAISSLSNTLAIQLERTLSSTIGDPNDQQILILANNITLAYVQFRCNLLNEEAKNKRLSNYEAIAEFSKAINDWKKVLHVHVLNMFESVQMIIHDLTFTRNCIKNYTNDASCCLVPIIIRPEDILCLLAPEQTLIIRTISANYTKIDEYLSDPALMTSNFDKTTLLEFDETTITSNITTGLASFIYDNDPKKLLINRENHLNYIINSAITFSKQLIDLCVESNSKNGFLMKLAMSVAELFPIQIVSSLGLIILANWSALSICEFEYRSRLDFLQLKGDESEIVTLEMELENLEKTYREQKEKVEQLEKEINKLNINLNLSENMIERREIREEIRILEKKKDDEQKQLNANKSKQTSQTKDIDTRRTAYNQKRQFEQEKWVEKVTNQIKLISNQIQKCIQTIETMCTDKSTTIDDSISATPHVGDVLINIVIELAHHQLVEFGSETKTPVINNDIIKAKSTIQKALIDLNDDASQLADKHNDPMYRFLQFYSSIMQIGLDTMINSIASWSIYSKRIQSKQMSLFVESKKKKDFCDLNKWIREKCILFIENVLHGDEITKLEEQISKRIYTDIGNLATVLSGDNSHYIQQSLGQFQHFIYNLLIAGCRYIQIRLGCTTNSLDDLLSPITREQINPDFPHTESDLLQLITMSETQFRSRSESLLYQVIHITFGLNTNIFSLIDKLDSSIETVDHLLLPSSYMIGQLWRAIDTLLTHISNKITDDEDKVLRKLCQVFFKNINQKLNDEDLFLAEQINSRFVANLFKSIEDLRYILEKNRSKMKTFCDDLFVHLNATLKEIMRGFIKSGKYQIQILIELNDGKTKDFHLLFDKTKNHDNIQLIDINRILKNKENLLNTSKANDKRLILQKIQIFYSLLRGLIDNLENIVMNMSFEPINYDFLEKLLETIKSFYTDGQNILKIPLYKVLYSLKSEIVEKVIVCFIVMLSNQT